MRPCLPESILRRYEVHNFRHAAEVLSMGCPQELAELVAALDAFRITHADMTNSGGNESAIPKKMAALLRPSGWFESRIYGDLLVTMETRATSGIERHERRLERFMDGHKIDFLTSSPA